mgnify:CR=1 FL=1
MTGVQTCALPICLVFQSSNGGFFLSTPLSEALTEAALDGVEHEEAFMVCDMMCRISMPWIPCVEGVDVVPVRLIFGWGGSRLSQQQGRGSKHPRYPHVIRGSQRVRDKTSSCEDFMPPAPGHT